MKLRLPIKVEFRAMVKGRLGAFMSKGTEAHILLASIEEGRKADQQARRDFWRNAGDAIGRMPELSRADIREIKAALRAIIPYSQDRPLLRALQSAPSNRAKQRLSIRRIIDAANQAQFIK
jgi:hypothetical protein